MNEYLIEIKLPDFFDASFNALIPRQRAFINKNMNDGIITSYALSLENSKLWVMLIAENEGKVRNIINNFPIISYITYEINKLTFQNSIKNILPSFSLN